MTLRDFINPPAYFTDADSTITSTGARDPLGFESIWSYLGREIFDNKITSIANDVRNYTLNLLHHSVIRQLKAEGVFRLISGKLKEGTHGREISDADVVTALLIFLENIMIYSLVRRDDTGIKVNTEGVIGSSKGLTAEFSNIRISPDKEAYILVNQANVGLSARYKTPFLKMEIFNEQYEYNFNREKHRDPWSKFESLDSKLTKLRNLVVALIKNLVVMNNSLLLNLEQPGDEIITIVKKYRSFFGSPSVAYKIGQFWGEFLGFENAPAKHVYSSMRKTKMNDNTTPYEEVIKRALKQAETENDNESRIKYQAIMETEKLIAPVRYVFDVLLSGQYGRLDKPLLNRVGNAINGLKKTSIPDIRYYFRPVSSSQYVKDRVNKLYTLVINQNDPAEFINGLLSYHSQIVEERKNAPWIRKEGNELKIISGMRGKEPKKVYPWFHSYYMDSLRNLIKGMYPKEVR